VAAVEDTLAPFAARPHWGKVFGAAPETIRGLYLRWADFAALLRRYDPAGTFRNEFMDRYFPPAPGRPERLDNPARRTPASTQPAAGRRLLQIRTHDQGRPASPNCSAGPYYPGSAGRAAHSRAGNCGSALWTRAHPAVREVAMMSQPRSPRPARKNQ
jgi:D-arabinono-1,4-lactone oxidase